MLTARSNKLLNVGRTAYSIVALFALIHVGLLVGLGLYAYFSGRVDHRKVEQIAEVLRGKQDAAPSEQVTAALVGGPKGSADTSAQMINDAIEKEELDRFQRERAMAELRQLNILWNRRALQLEHDQTAHQKRVAEFEEQSRRRREKTLSDAHKKTIATIGSMDAKRARDYLMSATEPDAIKILLELPDRKRKGMLESCKTQDQTARRDRMLSAMLRQPVLPRGTST